MSIKGQGHSLIFDLSTEFNIISKHTHDTDPGFMTLRWDIKLHNMILASNKTVFYNDLQIHLNKDTQYSGERFRTICPLVSFGIIKPIRVILKIEYRFNRR